MIVVSIDGTIGSRAYMRTQSCRCWGVIVRYCSTPVGVPKSDGAPST
jgi:hypothetical protein